VSFAMSSLDIPATVEVILSAETLPDVLLKSLTALHENLQQDPGSLAVFLEAGGPDAVFRRQNCMGRYWREEAKNGSMSLLSKIAQVSDTVAAEVTQRNLAADAQELVAHHGHSHGEADHGHSHPRAQPEPANADHPPPATPYDPAPIAAAVHAIQQADTKPQELKCSLELLMAELQSPSKEASAAFVQAGGPDAVFRRMNAMGQHWREEAKLGCMQLASQLVALRPEIEETVLQMNQCADEQDQQHRHHGHGHGRGVCGHAHG